MFRFLILFMTFALGQGVANATVWEDVNTWSPEWEARYSEWVYNEWQADFFSRKTLPNGQSNPYYGLRADCADTVYSMRIIFAFENKLPFVIKDPTTSNKTITNKMSRWKGQDERSRIRNFLVYVYGVASTASLPADTYPVALNRASVKSGGMMTTTQKNTHSWTIKQILPIGVPHFVYNSVVGANSSSELKERKSWPNPLWVFEGNFSASGHAGFKYWKPAEYVLRPAWEVPGYSEEQYKVPLGKWNSTVQKKLALRNETDDQMVQRLLGTVCEGLTGRVASVNDALNYSKNNLKCMDYSVYDTYSTPNRDRRVFDDFLDLRRAYRELLDVNNGNDLSPLLKAQLDKIFPFINSTALTETQRMQASNIDSFSTCTTTYGPQRTMDLAEFKRRLFAGLISNNPHDGLEYRWGDLRGPSQRAKLCRSWDHWSPNLTAE